jgi:hypothetical protein
MIPGTSSHEFLPDEMGHKPDLEKVQPMVQNALIHAIFHLRKKNREPSHLSHSGGTLRNSHLQEILSITEVKNRFAPILIQSSME